MDDALVDVPRPFPRLVERPTAIALEPTLAGVKASPDRIGGRARRQEWIGLDRVVDGPFVSVDMDLRCQ